MAKKEKSEHNEELSQADLEAKFGGEESEAEEKKEKKGSVKTKAKFSLDDYKKRTQTTSVSFKPQEWIKMGEAFQEITALPGLPQGHTIMTFGKSDVGKTTMIIDRRKFNSFKDLLNIRQHKGFIILMTQAPCPCIKKLE